MKILVACEFSGVVRDAFRKRGHDAWSCDLLPSISWEGGYHLEGNVRWWLDRADWQWDLMICHPDCTFLTNSAEWAYGDGPYHQKVKPSTLTGAARRKAREEAVEFCQYLFSRDISKIALENPVGHLSKRMGKPFQIIHPHQFGDDASKATCLWLKGLPLLMPTKSVCPRMVNGRPRWGNQTDSGQNKLSPSDDRALKRSITYQGIADAMAEQWGPLSP